MKLLSVAMLFIGFATVSGASDLSDQSDKKPLNLTDALSQAQRNHPMIAMALAKVDQAKAQGERMSAMFEPILSINGYGATGKGEMNLGTLIMPTMVTGLPDNGSYGFSSSMMWRPFSFGRDVLTRRASEAMVKMSSSEAAAASLSLAYATRSTFADALQKEATVQARKEALASAQEVEKTTKAMLDAGKAPQAFLYGAQAETAKMQKELAMAEADLQMAKAMLTEAIAADQSAEFILGRWNEALTAPSSLQQALDSAKQKRPELNAMKANSANAQFQLDLAKRAFLPDMALMAMADWMKPENMDEMDGQKLAFVISLPVFDGKERRAAKAEAESQLRQSQADRKATELKVQSEVAQAWAEWSASPAIQDAAEKELKSSEEAYRVALLRYQSGKSTLAEMTESRAQLAQARLSVAESHAYRQKAWTRLMRAIGS